MRWSLPAHPARPQDLWAAWNLEPSVILPLAVAVLLYAWGVHNARPRTTVPASRLAAFLGAVLSLLLALVSPLDALSTSLFSAHMVQHLVLMLISAPLLVLSDLPVVALWVLPRTWAQGLGRSLNRSRALSRARRRLFTLPAAWLLFAVPMWLWHARMFFQAALENEAVHTLEHLSFLITAMLFWGVLLRRSTLRHVHYGMAVPYLFTTALHSGILGALMLFASWAWYPYYAPRVGAWGLTPLEDQQLAGLIMWIPRGLVFTLLTVGYFAAWLHALERRSAQPPYDPSGSPRGPL